MKKSVSYEHQTSIVQVTKWEAGSLSVGDGFLTPFEPKPRAAIVTKIREMTEYPGHVEIIYKFIYRGAKGDMTLQIGKHESVQAFW